MEAFKLDENEKDAPVEKRRSNSDLFSGLLGLYNFNDIGKLVVSSNNIVFTPLVEVFEDFLHLKSSKKEDKENHEGEDSKEKKRPELKLVKNQENNASFFKKYKTEASRKLSGHSDLEDSDSGIIINKKHY
jgi:hypothetical protein